MKNTITKRMSLARIICRSYIYIAESRESINSCWRTLPWTKMRTCTSRSSSRISRPDVHHACVSSCVFMQMRSSMMKMIRYKSNILHRPNFLKTYHARKRSSNHANITFRSLVDFCTVLLLEYTNENRYINIISSHMDGNHARMIWPQYCMTNSCWNLHWDVLPPCVGHEYDRTAKANNKTNPVTYIMVVHSSTSTVLP